MANNDETSKQFLQLARIALTGRDQDIQLVIHRAAKKIKSFDPDLSQELVKLLQESPTRSTPLRRQVDSALPTDLDSRLHLLRIENSNLEHEIVLSDSIKASLIQVIAERSKTKILLNLGLYPTKSLLFTGPPGVGKTMAAKWIANQLGKPLLVLDLAAVMSSYLGRTGNNIRFVLDYAKNADCVLLIDEVDAIAKKRDDSTEIGELKRLVTVLLQEIDDWPSSGLLIAATNHPDLLDPAIWRRFELVVKFDNPEAIDIQAFIKVLLHDDDIDMNRWATILTAIFDGQSFSEIERQIKILRRKSAVTSMPLSDLLEDLLGEIKNLKLSSKIRIAEKLSEIGMSQRQVNDLTGVARDTLRKHINKDSK